MPGLFEQFPHTNFHELNLDWMIDLLNQFKQDLEDRAVISVNGMTGEVTLYESENVVLPPLTDASSWRLVRMMDGQYVGILFQDGHIWLQQGNSTLKLLTTEDIPTSAGVVSINGMGGIVRLTGADIPIDNSADPDSVRLALETEHTERVNADNALQNGINTINQNLHYVSDNISNLNTLPIGSMGRVTLAAGVSPTGGAINVQYVCMGESTRKTIIACIVNTTRTFVNTALNDTWLGWQELALKSNVTAKRYSVTTTTNANVSPFGAYVQLDIPSADRTNYGRMVSAIAHASSTNPAMCMITGGDDGILVYSKAGATFDIDVIFCKNYL